MQWIPLGHPELPAINVDSKGDNLFAVYNVSLEGEESSCVYLTGWINVLRTVGNRMRPGVQYVFE